MEAAPPLPQNLLELRLKTVAAAIRKPPPLLLCVLGEDEPICAAIEEFRTYIVGKEARVRQEAEDEASEWL